MANDNERIAVLETKVGEMQSELSEVLKLQRSMSEQLSKYKGFFGGIMFVFSSVGFVCGLAVQYFSGFHH